jgi:3-deoxy-7-phosphoheptulonate synthase
MKTANQNTGKMKKLPTFNSLKRLIPLTSFAGKVVLSARKTIENIILGKDPRIIIIAGPCSIHDPKEAIEFAKTIAKLNKLYASQFLIVMRFCFDKPRTRNDWPGIATDPWHDGTYDIAYGYKICRQTMTTILTMGVPLACEMLDRDNYHVLSDLISYAWIGARTVCSPLTRRVASGITAPLGLKNSNKDDTITEVINAMETITRPSVFAGSDNDGIFSRIPTKGNKLAHLLLRGGKTGPNYQTEYLNKSVAELENAGFCSKMVVDCSHGNSGSDYTKQGFVFRSVLDQIKGGDKNIIGLMLESYLDEGKQNGVRLGTKEAHGKLKPRLSVTDGCISIQELSNLLKEGYNTISE